jgi:hypothetical protein
MIFEGHHPRLYREMETCRSPVPGPVPITVSSFELGIRDGQCELTHRGTPARQTGAKEGAKDDTQNALSQVQTEFKAKKARRETAQIHRSTRPQSEHDPRLGGIARLGQHAIGTVSLDAQLPVEQPLVVPQLGQEASLAELGELDADILGI